MGKALDKLTAKELALAYCADIDRENEDEPRQHSDAEYHACMKSPVKFRRVVEWSEYYFTYADMEHTAGLFYGELMEAVEAIKGHLRVWECYQQEETRLNAVLEDLKELDNRDYTLANGTTAKDMFRVSAVEAMRRTLKDMPCTLAKITIDADGYFRYDCSKLFKAIENDMPYLHRRYKTAKEFLLGMEKWESQNKTAGFRPFWYRESLADIKNDMAFDVAPMYSRKELHRREQEGMKITQVEKQCAIFPYFEEVAYDKSEVDRWAEIFRELYETRVKATKEKYNIWG